MLDRVAGIISRYSMIATGGRVGVAVSGGADSVCLLHLLRDLAPALNLRLIVLHINHRLRADESDSDEEFVRTLAGLLEYPVLVETVNVADFGGNLEQAGRRARLTFYQRLIAAGQVDSVATGHTSSDQAETVLYRLLRGSGTPGLSGIRPITSDGIIRPLLDCRREEVEAYLTANGIKWREDRSNQERTFLRNRIRHDLLPQLRKEYNPALPQTLVQMSVLAQDDEQYWAAVVDRLAASEITVASDAVLLECSKLLSFPKAVSRRLLRRAIGLVKGDLRSIDFEHVEAVLELASAGEGHGRLQLPALDIFRSFDWLRIASPRAGSRSSRDYNFNVTTPAKVRIPGAGFTICLDLLEISESGYTKGGSLLDLKCISEPLQLRNWRPGDRYARAGRPIEKLKTLFQQERIPIWDRQGWPVLTSGDRIVWARKFGVSAEAFPAESATSVVAVTEISDAS